MVDSTTGQPPVFRDESCLSTDYSPDQCVGREREREAIAAAVQPLTRRQTPVNLLIHGPAGVGKTTVTSRVCEELADQSRIRKVQLNCWQYNTRPALLSQLLIELGYPAPRKGKPVDELLARLQEWLAKHRGVVAILDEFDRLQDQTEIVYDLQELSDAARNGLGLILVSNQPPATIDLEPRSESRLQYRSIEFTPYTAAELKAILEDRAETAFQPGVVSEEALTMIADRVAAHDGDCRHALELLHRAGRVAARANAETLTVEHVEQSSNPVRG